MKTPYLKACFAIILIALLFLSCQDKGSKELELTQSRVGLAMPTTGKFASYGAEGVLAARIALRHSKQTLNDSMLVLFQEDSASEPTQANSAATELVKEGVQLIVGEINSANTKAMIRPAMLAGIPILAPTASSISLTRNSDNLFRIWPSDGHEADKMKEFIISKNINKIGILYIETPYGEEMASYFEEEFKGNGGTITDESYREDTYDFKPLLLRMQDYEYLYLISYVNDAALILKQAYEMKSLTDHEFTFFGTSVLDSPQLIEKAGIASEGIVFAVVHQGVGSNDEKRAKFIEEYVQARENAQSDRYLRAASKEPTFAAFHVYDAVSLAFAACTASKKKGDLSGAVVSAYFREMAPYEGLTGKIAFDEGGDLAIQRTVVFKAIRDGKIEVLSK